MTTTGGPVMSALLVVLLAAPAVTAVVAFTAGRRRPRLAGGLGAVTAGAGFRGLGGPGGQRGHRAPSHRCRSTPPAAIRSSRSAADQLAVVLLLLVFGVSAIVQTFAMRYLAEDERAGWFAAGAGLLTAGSAAPDDGRHPGGARRSAGRWPEWRCACCSPPTGSCLAARDGVRRTATAFLIGDLALWAAVALIAARLGTVDLRALQSESLGGPIVAVAALPGGGGRAVALGADPLPPLASGHAGRAHAGLGAAARRGRQRRRRPADQTQLPGSPRPASPRRRPSSPASPPWSTAR